MAGKAIIWIDGSSDKYSTQHYVGPTADSETTDRKKALKMPIAEASSKCKMLNNAQDDLAYSVQEI